MVNQHIEWISAPAAAAQLGVKPATLYAYASRGLVRTAPGDDARSRRYAQADVARLKARADARAGHGAVAAGALRWGEPVLETSITDITPRGPAYRGHLAVDLAAAGAPFEAVATLLWSGALPASRPRLAARPLPDAAAVVELVRGAPPVAALEPACIALALADHARFGGSNEGARAATITATLAAALGLVVGQRRAAAAARAPSIAAAVLRALGRAVDDDAVDAVDRALVVVADHELNASTFAARVAASTGADLYACVRAGLATLSGPKHGGACDRVEALVREVDRPARARAVVVDRLARGEDVPGFGHPLYQDGDPRPTPLFACRAVRRAKGEGTATLRALVDAAAAAGLPGPTIDTGLVVVATALRLPAGSAAGLFAIGRVAGFIAHALEQRARPELLRPRARYVG